MDDDLYGDDDMTSDGPCQGAQKTANQIGSKLYNDGYRIGKAKEEEHLMQVGFDVGFQRGVILGRACGELYGACRALAVLSTADFQHELQQVDHLLFEDLPTLDNETIDTEWMAKLRAAILAISIELAPKIDQFEEKVMAIDG